MAEGSGIIICYATCWSCKFGYHSLEPHPWWDSEDVEHAESMGRPHPEGMCACNCEAAIKYEEEYENEAVGSHGHEVVQGDGGSEVCANQ